MTKKQAADMDLGVEVSKGFVGKVVQAVFGFIGIIIFARVLGPTKFGGFYLLLSLVELLKRPVSGVAKATRKRFAEANSLRGELLGAQIGLNLLFLLILFVPVLILKPYLVSYTGLQEAPLLFVILFAAVANFPPFQNLLFSIGRLGVQTWIDTLRSVVTFVLQLAFVLWGYGATGMVYGLSAGTFLMFPITHYYLRTLPTVPSTATLRSIWSFARYSVPTSIVGKAYDRFDVLLLGFLAAPAAVGQYEVAYKLTVPASFIAGLTSAGLFAKVSDLHSRDEDITTDLQNTLAFSSLTAIPLFFGALAIADETVVTAYGPEYKSAAELLVGLAAYRFITTQTGVLTSVVNGLDLPRYEFRASIGALTLNIPLGVSLYYELGPLGVVLATVIAELFRYLFLYRAVSRRTRATLIPRALYHQVFSGVIMFSIVSIINMYVAVQSWLDLIPLLIVGSTVYFSILLLISRHFRMTIRNVMGQAVSDLVT